MDTLQFAKQKVASVLEVANSVLELDFPYEGPHQAIIFIRDHFSALLEDLTASEPLGDTRNARNLCQRASEEIDRFLFTIGFMVRACDIRGPLELQGPLHTLTQKALSANVQLVISSEWEFSPFTMVYPEEFGNQYVLVGLPVSEASNPLIAPLAGHELGHNIWRRLENLQNEIGSEIETLTLTIICDEQWEPFSKLFGINRRNKKKQTTLFTDINGASGWTLPVTWGRLQCEEMFCDFVGLCIFGEAYLQAFRYLTSPGSTARNPAYPGVRERVNALIAAAHELNINVPNDYESAFEVSAESTDPREQLLLQISDKASQALVLRLVKEAKNFCDSRNLISRDPEDVQRIIQSFKLVVPATGAKSLANIINAAWSVYLDKTNHWEADYPITSQKPELRVQLLKDLALKSFEVFQIETILETHDASVVS